MSLRKEVQFERTAAVFREWTGCMFISLKVHRTPSPVQGQARGINRSVLWLEGVITPLALSWVDPGQQSSICTADHSLSPAPS